MDIINFFKMKLFLTTLFAFLLGFNLTAIAQNSFPESWVGNYKGELFIYGVDSVKMKVYMELNISSTKKDSVYNWTIIYDLKGKKDIRAYELIVVNREKGLYRIDEKNSIVIEAYLRNNRVLTSFFKVSESFIIATYTKENNNLIFEIISAKSDPASITGNTKSGEEEIQEITTFPINGRQKAIMEKKL